MLTMQISNSDSQSRLVTRLEQAIIGCIVLIAVFAPHSIAVTQIGWLLGMTLWVIRLMLYPRPKLFRSPIDYALLGFFILSGISALFSYSPFTSIGKLRAASLFTLVYLVSQNIRSLRLVRYLALTLIASCTINVLWTAGQFALGKGVKLQGVNTQSPLAKAVFHTRTVYKETPIVDGDTIWQIDGQQVNSPEELAAILASGSSVAKVRIYRVEWMPELEVPRQLLNGTNALQQLGISGWSRGRDWRATGFFNHWVTYSEVLQLIASLALGIFLALKEKKSLAGGLLLLAIVGLVFALGMTVTRASWIGFALSAFVMLLVTSSRRTLLIVGACAIPLVLASAVWLQQKRSVGFFDRTDQSTSWREMVWRDGFELLINNPRHLVVGVGIDSIKSHWREWGLFDEGRQPMGHMHSNILQIALERGLPAVIVWLILHAIYLRMLWRIIRRSGKDRDFVRGLAVGALGGTIGFLASGLVHYNWGDSEVVSVFYFIVGLCLVVDRTDQLQDGSSVSV